MKNSLKAFAALAAAACLSLPGCGSLQRLGTDVVVVVTSPVTVPLAAVHDSIDWGDETSGATPVLLAPLNIPLHAIKHVAYTVVYAADACLSPLYLLASIGGGDLEPIDLYSFTDGYPWQSQPWPYIEE
ncbi:MAG: hypothetical protein FJ293_09500 [Planctomycetes bacterium]|nr:hypothetical protein [Planctomycetota bacterium]